MTEDRITIPIEELIKDLFAGYDALDDEDRGVYYQYLDELKTRLIEKEAELADVKSERDYLHKQLDFTPLEIKPPLVVPAGESIMHAAVRRINEREARITEVLTENTRLVEANRKLGTRHTKDLEINLHNITHILKLETAFDKYAQHLPTCKRMTGNTGECTCGLVGVKVERHIP